MVDLIWAPEGYISKLKIPNDRYGLQSDHLPVMFTLPRKRNNNPLTNFSRQAKRDIYYSWKWDTPNGLDLYKKMVKETNLQITSRMMTICNDLNLDNQCKVKCINSIVTDNIIKLASASFGRTNNKPGAKSWWSYSSATRNYRKARSAI